ncbi:hypothetical protein O6H91_13G035800 [Diphasiastrum complanatum]|uniref:Uncharacterized protein n=1 Tax=Diphasiastrum complanatum TaxID=34168 RepID=A0ACC2BUU5_DIPCM|nr:hypothetical protein O6H91_13G035800 [Diphasiastrum complanatum]
MAMAADVVRGLSPLLAEKVRNHAVFEMRETPVNVRDLHKGLESIASSMSLLSQTLGSALEESYKLMELNPIEEFSLATASQGAEKCPIFREGAENLKVPHVDTSEDSEGLNKVTKFSATHNVAESMATKAKLLLRELRRVKADLAFMQTRSVHVEEENKRLRESFDKGISPDEDDLVRLQLEALLKEKARLTQENANYARENQLLHEVIEYHQLSLHGVSLPEDSFEEVHGVSLPEDSFEEVLSPLN